MDAQQHYFVKILRRKLTELRDKNERISLRAFARRLEVSSGALSEYLSGKRKPSAKKMLEILERVNASEKEKARLLSMLDVAPLPERVEIHGDHYDIVEDWHFFAIRNIFLTDSLPQSHNQIAQRLGLSLEQVETSVRRLLELGLLTLNDDGEIEHSRVQISTSDNIGNSRLQKAHVNKLRLAEEKLKSLPVHERDFTAMYFVGNRMRLALVKDEIRKFYEKISFMMDDLPNADVFQMCIQLYPLTTAAE